MTSTPSHTAMIALATAAAACSNPCLFAQSDAQSETPPVTLRFDDLSIPIDLSNSLPRSSDEEGDEERVLHRQPRTSLGALNNFSLKTQSTEGWVITGGPYLFLPGIEGDAVVAGKAAKLDLSFGDIFDNFDVIGVSGRLEAWRDSRWGITFDAMYFDLDGSFTSPVPLSIDLVQWQIDLGLGLRVIDKKLTNGDSDSRRLQVDLLGGVRFQYLKEELTIGASPKLGASEDWFEPFVGGRVVLQVNDKLAMRIRADAGGFGLGEASELTWNVWAGISYRINHKTEMLVGYKAQGFDYSNGSGLSQFGGDWTTQGISLAMAYRF